MEPTFTYTITREQALRAGDRAEEPMFVDYTNADFFRKVADFFRKEEAAISAEVEWPKELYNSFLRWSL